MRARAETRPPRPRGLFWPLTVRTHIKVIDVYYGIQQQNIAPFLPLCSPFHLELTVGILKGIFLVIAGRVRKLKQLLLLEINLLMLIMVYKCLPSFSCVIVI